MVEPDKPAPEVVVVESAAGQASAAQLRSQKSEIAQLREDLAASRSRADAADAAARETQQAVLALQTELANVRARADAAAVQSEKAFGTVTEVLQDLVAAREAQRSIVERNLETFDAMDMRLANIESLVAETRRQRDSDAAAVLTLSTATNLKLQQADNELMQLRAQLAELNQHNEQLRAAFNSAPMISMLRELEETRRDTSMLRGAMEQMQREQEDARERMQNYYLDLDARIQALQERERAARDATNNGTGAAIPADSATPGGEQTDPTVLNFPETFNAPEPAGAAPSDGGSESLPPLQIVPFEVTPQKTDEGAASVISPAEESPAQEGASLKKAADPIAADPISAARPDVIGEPANEVQNAVGDDSQTRGPQPVTAHGVIITDWDTGRQPTGQPPAQEPTD